MNVTQRELFQAFESLPTEAQRQALNFIAFLQHTYAPVTDLPNIAVKSSDITRQHQEVTLQEALRRSLSIVITVRAIAKSVDKICKRSPILLCI